MSYRKVAETMTEQSGNADRLPCHRCQTPTARAALANYGAMCFTCYEAYCGHANAKQPLRNDTPNQRDMRTRLRGFKAPNVLNRSGADELDPDRIEKAKREADRRVAEYARTHALPLPDAGRARVFGDER